MKKTINSFSLTLTVILCLTAGLLCSCTSNRDKLLETVPDDSEIVLTANLVKLAKDAGVTVEDGRLVLPIEYSELRKNIPTDALKDLGRAASAVDIENVVIFGSIRDNVLFITAAVTDIDELKALIRKSDMERSTENGRTVYSESESKYADCIVISENEEQMWYVPGRRYLSKIDDFEYARKKNNILRYSGLASALKAGNIVNLIIDPSALQNGFDNYWLTASINVSNNAIVAEAKAMKPDGEEYKTDTLQPVDTDFLRYMPANFIAAAAIGINGNSDWTGDISKALSSMLGYQAKSVLDEVMPYLKAIDGTVALGFGPKDKRALFGSSNPADWQAVFMAKMRQDKVNDLISMANNLFPRAKKLSNGLYSISEDGATVTYGMVDGCFAVGLGTDLEPNKSNSFSGDFNGKPLAIVAQTPLLSSLVNETSLNYSIKATLQVNGTATRIEISLVGTDKPIIPTLINDMPLLGQAYYNKIYPLR